tara:strand:- start:382 stop:1068 length:687 start_codon:yes stop_codon:yes gene_type:complete
MNKDKVIAIILARKNSLRLKNKLSLKIGNLNILEFFYHRLSKCKNIDKIVMAVPKSDKLFFDKIAKNIHIPIHYGPEKNVLKRFYDTSVAYNYKYIVRANADCPLIMPNLIDKNIKRFKLNNCDLFTPFRFNYNPFGSSLCIFKISAIRKIFKLATKIQHKEHIENFCFDNERFFKIMYDDQSSINLSHINLTLDTDIDYRFILELYNHLKNQTVNTQFNYLCQIYKK